MKLYEFGKKVTKLMEKNCPTDPVNGHDLKIFKKKFDVYPSSLYQRMDKKTTKEKVVVGENVRGNQHLNQTIEHSKKYMVLLIKEITSILKVYNC